MVKKFFNIFNILINLLFVALFLLSGLSTQISPEKFILPAYLGLVFLPLMLINILFVFFWAIKLKWYFVFSLFVLILMYGNIRNDFPLNGSKKNIIAPNDTCTHVKILTYNVKLFDFFKKIKGQNHYNKTVDYILKQNADVVCLQEFGYYNTDHFLTADNILSSFNTIYKYHHICYHLSFNDKSTYGVATFSKYPILNKGDIDYNSKYNHTIYSDIQFNDRIIRLFNCHLESNQLTFDDKKRMMQLVDSTSKKSFSETTGLLTRKLGAAYRRRAHQADMVAEEIKKSPYEVIVCGDFNDTPISYAYKKVRGNLSDVFVDTSSGLGISYNELPFLYRIDYIFHSKTLSAGKFKVDKEKLSDHYPVSCTINLN
jgi:endonuclease/exonuclease/phosphatase family metal-dependent hydrolase